MRVVAWGTYDLGKPRMRILLQGLRDAGCDVIEINRDVWAGVDDKSQLSSAARAWRLLKTAAAYPGLMLRYLRAPKHDAVLVGYMGQFDVLALSLLARMRGAPLVWDMFISLYDTVAFDRALARPGSFAARALRALERMGCRAADLVLMDTESHARRIERLLDAPRGKLDWAPVGAETDRFRRLPPPKPAADGRIRVLFYGQMIPLHGVRTILDAAGSPRGAAYDWTLIGRGQDDAAVRTALADNPDAPVTWLPWTPYEELISRIEASHICLGIFGGSEKAASVIPNKVYQALAAGRAIVTRGGPAAHALFGESARGVRLVPPNDPDALLDAIEALAAEGCPQPEERLALRTTPREIGALLLSKLGAMKQGNLAA